MTNLQFSREKVQQVSHNSAENIGLSQGGPPFARLARRYASLPIEECSFGAKLLLADLQLWAGSRGVWGDNPKDDATFPRLAREHGASLKSIRRGLKQLRSLGFVSWKRKRTNSEGQQQHVFTVQPFPEGEEFLPLDLKMLAVPQSAVCPGAKLVRAFLEYRGRNGSAFPGHKNIATGIGCKPRYAKRLMEQAEEKLGVSHVRRRRTTNLYSFGEVNFAMLSAPTSDGPFCALQEPELPNSAHAMGRFVHTEDSTNEESTSEESRRKEQASNARASDALSFASKNKEPNAERNQLTRTIVELPVKSASSVVLSAERKLDDPEFLELEKLVGKIDHRGRSKILQLAKGYSVSLAQARYAFACKRGKRDQVGGLISFMKNWDAEVAGLDIPACLICEDTGLSGQPRNPNVLLACDIPVLGSNTFEEVRKPQPVCECAKGQKIAAERARKAERKAERNAESRRKALEILAGEEKAEKEARRRDVCPRCTGDAVKCVKCVLCNGTGLYFGDFRDPDSDDHSDVCHDCKGRKITVSSGGKACTLCHGTGKRPAPEHKIPRSVEFDAKRADAKRAREKWIRKERLDRIRQDLREKSWREEQLRTIGERGNPNKPVGSAQAAPGSIDIWDIA